MSHDYMEKVFCNKNDTLVVKIPETKLDDFIIKGFRTLLLFPQHFARYVLRPSSDVCLTREPTWNFKLRPLLNPSGGCRFNPDCRRVTIQKYLTQKYFTEYRTGDNRRFNKRRSSKFRVGSRVQQTREEGWRTYRPKRYGSKNKDEDNIPKTLND